MSWLSDRTGIHLGAKQLGQWGGTGIGFLLGGPAGAALGAGLGRLGGGVASGENPLQAIEHGAVAGGTSYGLGKLLGLFQPGQGLEAGADSAVPQVSADSVGTISGGPTLTGVSDSGAPIMGQVGGAGAPPPSMSPASIAAGAPTSSAERALSFAKSAGSGFLHNAPAVQATAGLAGGVLNARNESANRDLQRQEFEYQKSLTNQQLERQKNAESTREALLAALFQRFGLGASPPPPGAR